MDLGKPMLTVSGPEDVPDINRWLKDLPDGIELCIGGPRASECPDAYNTAKMILELVAAYEAEEADEIYPRD